MILEVLTLSVAKDQTSMHKMCSLIRTFIAHIHKLETHINAEANIIQLMHSFEVNIRICQPENSDVHRGEAEVNITFEG